MAEFKNVIKNRRSIYALGTNSEYSIEEIVEVVEGDND